MVGFLVVLLRISLLRFSVIALVVLLRGALRRLPIVALIVRLLRIALLGLSIISLVILLRISLLRFSVIALVVLLRDSLRGLPVVALIVLLRCSLLLWDLSVVLLRGRLRSWLGWRHLYRLWHRLWCRYLGWSGLGGCRF